MAAKRVAAPAESEGWLSWWDDEQLYTPLNAQDEAQIREIQQQFRFAEEDMPRWRNYLVHELKLTSLLNHLAREERGQMTLRQCLISLRRPLKSKLRTLVGSFITNTYGAASMAPVLRARLLRRVQEQRTMSELLQIVMYTRDPNGAADPRGLVHLANRMNANDGWFTKAQMILMDNPRFSAEMEALLNQLAFQIPQKIMARTASFSGDKQKLAQR